MAVLIEDELLYRRRLQASANRHETFIRLGSTPTLAHPPDVDRQTADAVAVGSFQIGAYQGVGHQPGILTAHAEASKYLLAKVFEFRGVLACDVHTPFSVHHAGRNAAL
jgi:hypothetical protein